MIGQYAVVSARIRQELAEIERVVTRAERAVARASEQPTDSAHYYDSAALNLHDFYVGLERVFQHIASGVDQSVPSGREWHRELLRQMNAPIAKLRPSVLTDETYSYEFRPERIAALVGNMRAAFEHVRAELVLLADWLERLAEEAE